MGYSFQDILNAVRATTSDPHEQATLLYACGAETGCQSIAQYGGGPGRGPWQIETAGGSGGRGVTTEQAMNPATAAPLFYKLWNVAGCTAQQGALWVTNPKQAAYLAARCSEGGGSTAAANVGAPYNASQRAAGERFAGYAGGGGVSFNDCLAAANNDPQKVRDCLTQQTNGAPVAGNPITAIPGVSGVIGIGQLAGSVGGIATLLAKVFDAFSSPDFWVSVLLVMGGGFLTITGLNAMVHSTGAYQQARGAATAAAGAA